MLRLLVQRGFPVRAISRSSSQVKAWRDEGIDAAQADLAHLEDALVGCQQLFLLSASVPDQLAQDKAAIDAAKSAGIRRIVRVSSADAHPDSPVPWANAHAHADRYLAESGVPHVILRPSAFMSNLLSAAPAIRAGLLPHTSGAGTAGWIDTRDIAACAVAVLGEGDKHTGSTYVLTGPERLSFPDVARWCSAVLRRSVRSVWLPGPLYGLLLRGGGQSPWLADALVAQFADVLRSGRDEPGLTDNIQTLTGRAPASIADFIRRSPEFRR